MKKLKEHFKKRVELNITHYSDPLVIERILGFNVDKWIDQLNLSLGIVEDMEEESILEQGIYTIQDFPSFFAWAIFMFRGMSEENKCKNIDNIVSVIEDDSLIEYYYV